MVNVAQLVEPWIVVPVVVGSSPIVHPIFIMLIIISGPSGVGKGTIIQQLLALNHPYHLAYLQPLEHRVRRNKWRSLPLFNQR